jgi:hypothetical protein
VYESGDFYPHFIFSLSTTKKLQNHFSFFSNFFKILIAILIKKGTQENFHNPTWFTIALHGFLQCPNCVDLILETKGLDSIGHCLSKLFWAFT